MHIALQGAEGAARGPVHSVTTSTVRGSQDTLAEGESPDQTGGDDETRTHDPLLANTPDADDGEQ
jgi:hypothetical protein